jgi:hypothetical protein
MSPVSPSVCVCASRPRRQRVEERLHAWNDKRELDKLGEWLKKFDAKEGTSLGGLRVPIDARVSAGEVFLKVEAEATRVLDSKKSARAVAAAADAAAVAAANCQKAAEAVAIAGAALEKAAKQLLDLRKAEIEAKALVDEAGAGDGAGDDADAAVENDAGDETLNAEKATPKPTAAASALLAEKASEAVAAELVRARKAAAEAAQHAADAEAAWEAAKAAVADAERARGDAEATESARVASESALMRAVAAGDAASASLRLAQEASASVDKTVARADAAVAAADADDVAAAEALGLDAKDGEDLTTKDEAEASPGEDAASDENASSEEASKNDTETNVKEHTSLPGKKLVSIPSPLLEAIRERWVFAEKAYVDGLRGVFRDIRSERSSSVARFAETKSDFHAFLKRPDEKMSIVRAFQREFNEIDLDHRRDSRTVGELLVRADELRDALWDVCDERLAENVAERAAVAADTWAADHAKAAVAHYCALVQLELDKFAETAPVLADYFAARRGEPLPEEPEAARDADADENSAAANADAAGDSPPPVSWFEPPPPVPDVVGFDPGKVDGGADDADQPETQKREAVPPPPVPSPDDADLPEYVLALVREPENASDASAAPAAEGDSSAGGAPAEEDPNPVPGPTAPALAGALAAALAYVRAYAPDADETVAEGDAAADAEDVAAGDGGDDAIGENADPSTSLQAPGETAAAMREERRVFEARLERIADRCATHVAELGDLARLCHKRMAAMVKQKYKAECGAVAALAEEVKVAAENHAPLEKDLLLEMIDESKIDAFDDQLVVAEEETAIPPPPSPPAPPPAEPAPIDPGAFSGSQFFNLCAALADAAPSGVITPAECASVMERLCVVEGAPQLQTMQSEFSNSLPPAYASAGRRRLANVARLFKFGDSPYVEWRALAISVLAAMYPAILDAKPETVAASAAQLRAPAKAGKKVFAQARKLWFLPSGGDPREEDDEEDAFAAGQRTWGAASLAARTGKSGQKKSTLSRRAPSGDVAAANVMAGLAECFGAPGPDGEVDIVSLALHLCVSATPELGAGKAVEVAKWLIDPEAEREEKRVLAKAEREKERAERRAKGRRRGESC